MTSSPFSLFQAAAIDPKTGRFSPQWQQWLMEFYLEKKSGGSGGTEYVLPTATASRLGGVKQGTGLLVASDGTLSLGTHTHAISDTTGLQDALDGKASASHTHAASEVAGVQAAANQRQTVTLTLSAATGTVDLGQTFEVLDETASAPGRFRLYRTTAGRDADIARAVETKAPNNVGLLLEDVFVAGSLSISEDPAPCSAGSDGLCAWSWSGDLGATITLEILQQEA